MEKQAEKLSKEREKVAGEKDKIIKQLKTERDSLF